MCIISACGEVRLLVKLLDNKGKLTKSRQKFFRVQVSVRIMVWHGVMESFRVSATGFG